MAYRERVWPPPLWWVLAALLALSAVLAVGFYLGPVAGLAAGLGTLLVAGGLLGSSATLLEVSDAELRVGRARLELPYIGQVAALDAAATAQRSGPGADARAFLVLRPYVDTAVEITLDDPADPTPYWLVSTRHPRRLTAALTSRLAAGSDR